MEELGGKRKKHYAAQMEDLPLELSFKIILRCDLKTLFLCKCVCKSWCDIIDSEYFAQITSRPKAPFVDGDSRGNTTKILSLKEDYDYNNGANVFRLSESPLAKIIHSSWSCATDLSSHGLFLFRDNYCEAPCFLFNPLRGELLQLPRKEKFGDGFYGIGYDSIAKTYKVVHVYENGFDSELRKKNHGNSSLSIGHNIMARDFCCSSSICAYGDVHWGKALNKKLSQRVILASDVKEETFRFVGYPEIINYDTHVEKFCLFDFRGCLGLAYIPVKRKRNYSCRHIQVWKMKDYQKKERAVEYKIEFSDGLSVGFVGGVERRFNFRFAWRFQYVASWFVLF